MSVCFFLKWCRISLPLKYINNKKGGYKNSGDREREENSPKVGNDKDEFCQQPI